MSALTNLFLPFLSAFAWINLHKYFKLFFAKPVCFIAGKMNQDVAFLTNFLGNFGGKNHEKG